MFTWIKNLFRRSAAETVASIRGIELKVRAEELKAKAAVHDEWVSIHQKASADLRAAAALAHAEYDKLKAAFDAAANLF